MGLFMVAAYIMEVCTSGLTAREKLEVEDFNSKAARQVCFLKPVAEGCQYISMRAVAQWFCKYGFEAKFIIDLLYQNVS